MIGKSEWINKDYTSCFLRFRWQFDLILMLEQVKSQVLERSLWSFEVDDFHALIENGQDSFHEVFIVVAVLQFVPLSVLELALVGLFLLGAQTRLESLNFKSPLLFSVLDRLDKVVSLHHCTVRFNLNHVLVDELLI